MSESVEALAEKVRDGFTFVLPDEDGIPYIRVGKSGEEANAALDALLARLAEANKQSAASARMMQARYEELETRLAEAEEAVATEKYFRDEAEERIIELQARLAEAEKAFDSAHEIANREAGARLAAEAECDKWRTLYGKAFNDADRYKDALEAAEAELMLAIERAVDAEARLAEAEKERDGWRREVQVISDQLRDGWMARAVAAEADRDKWRTLYGKAFNDADRYKAALEQVQRALRRLKVPNVMERWLLALVRAALDPEQQP